MYPRDVACCDSTVGGGMYYGAVVNFQKVAVDSVVPPAFLAQTCQ